MQHETQYAIALTAESSCFITAGDTIELTLLDPATLSPTGIVQRVRLHSLFFHEGFDASMPRALKFVVEGKALDSDSAITLATKVCDQIRAMVGFIDNSSVGPVSPQLFIDATPGRTQTSFWQLETPRPTRMEPPTRHLPSTILDAFLAAFTRVAVGPEWLVALEAFNNAMGLTRPGSEAALINATYVCIESISRLVFDDSLQRHGGNQESVRDEFSAPSVDATPKFIRIHHILKGDESLHSRLNKARNLLAHGHAVTHIESELERIEILHALGLGRLALLQLLHLDEATFRFLSERLPYLDLLANGFGGTLAPDFDIEAARSNGYTIASFDRRVTKVTEPSLGDREIKMGIVATTHIPFAVSPGNSLYDQIARQRAEDPESVPPLEQAPWASQD